MNQLENIMLETSTINNGNIIDSTITNSIITTNSLNIDNFGVVNLNNNTAINIEGVLFTGLDLKEMMLLKDKLKQIYPEMFI